MSGTLQGLVALVLFLVGIKLSAFFSGAETGFYRLSYLRLSIDAQSGDSVARRLLWFSRNPSYFVATTLVGNNVANYVTTVAIGMAVVLVVKPDAGWVEIVGTLVLSPLVFIFGELVPKYLYYRAPMRFLRRDIFWFNGFYWLFLGVSFPLIWLTKFLERLGGVVQTDTGLAVGRSRLAHVLTQGHREGLIKDVQNRLVNGLLGMATRNVMESVTPASRVLGVAADAGRDEVLDVARRYGLTKVIVRRTGSEESWYGYLRVADVAVAEKAPAQLIVTMPQVAARSSKLETLVTLRATGSAYGAVTSGDVVVGVVSEHGLVEQLFRTPQSVRSPAALSR